MACRYLEAEHVELPLPVYMIACIAPDKKMLSYWGGPIAGWVLLCSDALGYPAWDDAEAIREVIGGEVVLRVYGTDFTRNDYKRTIG